MQKIPTVTDLVNCAKAKGFEELAENLRDGTEHYFGVNPMPVTPIRFKALSGPPIIIGAGMRGEGRSLTSIYRHMLAPCTCGSSFCFPLRHINGSPKMLREGDPTDDVFVKCMDCGKQNEASVALESINAWNNEWNKLHPENKYDIYYQFDCETELTQQNKDKEKR